MIPSSIAFTIFTGTGFFLSLIPLYWHLDAANVGTCMYMIWAAIACLVHFVGAIVWNGNAVNWAPVWCDITTRLQVGFTIAWPACGLCISRRLYFIATTTTVTSTRADKRREMLVDFAIALGIPLVQMLLQLVVSGHRFNIFENYGCFPDTWNTPLSFVLVYSWPVIIGAVSATYGFFTVLAFMKRRKQFKGIISNNAMTYNRYWRLILLATVDFMFTLPLGIWTMVGNARDGVSAWVSWDDTHSGYSRVFQFPTELLDHEAIVGLEILRWAAPFCAFLFFAFFGFAEEAKKNYRSLGSTITKRFGFTTFTESAAISDSMVKSGTASQGGVSLPVFITHQTESKRDSFDSYSDKFSTSITIGEYDLKVQPHSPTEHSTSSSSSSVISSDDVPRVPESILDPTSARKPSVPDAPKSVHPDNAFDQV